jgi:hypothetical protein
VPSFAPSVAFRDAVFDFARWRQGHPVESAPDPTTDAVIDRLVTGYHLAAKAFGSVGPAQTG